MINVDEKTELSTSEKSLVVDLWNNEYPAQVILKGIHELDLYYSNITNARHFLLHEGELIIGWASKFERAREKWFLIIVHRDFQHKGIGRELLHYIIKDEENLNGWVVDHNDYKKSDGTTYQSPLSFYAKNGFEIFENTRVFNGKINAIKIIYNRT